MQLLILSASANKLSKLNEKAEEYASLIMEELDPENLGYIEVKSLPLLFLSINDFLTMLSIATLLSQGPFVKGSSGRMNEGGEAS